MDIIHDLSHRTWYHIGTQHAALIPSYVLDATLPEKTAADALPDRAYADDVRRLFPIVTPVDTWLSAAYFAKHAEEVYTSALRSHVESRIKEAAAVFGIADDVATIMTAIRQVPEVKQASDSGYGWVNGTERKYPMFDAKGVHKAAEYFMENRYQYPPAMRKTIAAAIMRKAGEYKVDVPTSIRKEAGHGMPRRDTLMAELLARAQMTKDAEISAAIANLNEIIPNVDMAELGGVLDKFAEIVDALDNAENLRCGYGKRLLAPAEFIYDLDPKEAQALAEDSVELNHWVFSITKLAALSPDIYSGVLGDDFAIRIKAADGKIDKTKLADELFSLPRPDRAALESHLKTVFS
jgi:hypothetical protein